MASGKVMLHPSTGITIVMAVTDLRGSQEQHLCACCNGYNMLLVRRNMHQEGAQMARREIKKERGVFERPKGSGVWWINYFEGAINIGRRPEHVNLHSISTRFARLTSFATASCPSCGPGMS
jgi:hypothetical protein